MADIQDPTATDQISAPAPAADPKPAAEGDKGGSSLQQFAGEGGNQEPKSGLANFKPKEGEPTDAAEEKPIEYKDFNLPEDAGLPESLMDEFRELAGSNKLEQEQAQKYLDLGMKIADAREEAATKLITESQKQWEAERKESPTYKADGAAAYRAMSKAGLSDEEQGFLLKTWVGDHPIIRKVLIALDKATSEGKILDGGEPQDKRDLPLYEKMWPNNK